MTGQFAHKSFGSLVSCLRCRIWRLKKLENGLLKANSSFAGGVGVSVPRKPAGTSSNMSRYCDAQPSSEGATVAVSSVDGESEMRERLGECSATLLRQNKRIRWQHVRVSVCLLPQEDEATTFGIRPRLLPRTSVQRVARTRLQNGCGP